MVTSRYYVDDEQTNYRYPSRTFGFPLMHERLLPRAMEVGEGSRSHAPSPDPRSNDQEDTQAPPKRRVAVACGRCRRRKIRCSGDAGSGAACEGCRQAQVDNCQFLRVNSETAQWRADTPNNDDDYDPAPPRGPYRMPPGSSYPQGYQQISPTGADGNNAFRHNATTPYNHTSRSIGGEVATYDYSDDHAEYSCQHMAPHMDYSSATAQRSPSWAPASRHSGAVTYPDQDTQYTNQMPYQPHNYALRPAINQDLKNYSLGSTAIAPIPGPPTFTGNDRVLPFPNSSRPTQFNSFIRGEPLPVSLSSAANSSFNGVLGPTIKTMNSLSLNDNQSVQHHGSSYLVSNNGSDSEHTSPLTYHSQSHGLNTNHNNYTHSWDADAIFPSSSHGLELYSTERKQSQGSHLGDLSLPPLHDGNIHPYTPLPVQHPNHISYPQPPMDLHSTSRRVNSLKAL